MNKRLYTINGSEIMLDFDSILSFYIDGEIDTYHAKWYRWLNILIGNKMGEPTKIKYIIDNYGNELLCYDGKTGHIDNRGRVKDVEKLYQDLVQYFKNE